MSIICTTFLPDGIIMAADSRLTGTRTSVKDNQTQHTVFTVSDNYQKLVLLDKTKIGISSCGDAMIDNKSISDYIRVFEIEKVSDTDSVEDVANKLIEYVGSNTGTMFFVCGYSSDIPYVYDLIKGCVNRRNIAGNTVFYNSLWGGKKDAIVRLVNTDPPAKINWSLMPLKDGIDFSEFVIELSIKYERFLDNIQTCGGSADILVLTKDDAFWYKHKVYKC